MKTWKMVSGIVSMLASAAVLTSVLTSYKNLGGTSAQPAGLICLGLAALILGLAGIVQVVFRDGLIERARIVTVALFAVAAFLFLITAILAFMDVNGWVQIITLIVWSLGCAAFAYVDYTWAYGIGTDEHLAEQDGYGMTDSDDDDDYDFLSEKSADDETAKAEDSLSASEEENAMPDVGAPVDTSLLPDVDSGLEWDGSGPPPRIG